MRWAIFPLILLFVAGGHRKEKSPAPPQPLLISPILLEAIAPPNRIFTNTLTLEWQEPNDPTVTFYRLYHGTNTGTYYEAFDTLARTNRITVTVTRSWGTRHFFVAVSATTNDFESLPSNEVMWPGFSTNVPVTNIVLVVPGPFPAAIYTRTSLMAGQWQFFTNVTATNTVLPIDTTIQSRFFTGDRPMSVTLP